MIIELRRGTVGRLRGKFIGELQGTQHADDRQNLRIRCSFLHDKWCDTLLAKLLAKLSSAIRTKLSSSTSCRLQP